MTVSNNDNFSINEEEIECLGDLGRYRMAIEDENLRNREIWLESPVFGIARRRTVPLMSVGYITT